MASFQLAQLPGEREPTIVLIRMVTLPDNFDNSRHPQRNKRNLSLSFLLVYLEKNTHNLLLLLLSKNGVHHLVPHMILCLMI